MAPLFLLCFLLLFSISSGSPPLSLEIHDRFSDRVRRWADSNGHPGTWWPEHGTAEYYDALSHHDKQLHHRRSLATLTTEEQLAFANGNATYRFSSLGYLYYAEVTLGTPNVTFLVALDTGSDLFWVPCNCKQCAPLTSASYGNFEFNTYDPAKSNTSEVISCKSNSCDVQSSCSGSNANCTYEISYLSSNTSTSGILMEDVLYLTTKTTQQTTLQASITFGCGEVQTGTFLDGGAPNGLMGLSMSKLSVPSILSNKGLTANSFSMCFSEDGNGRINFGDQGSSDQRETPLDIDSQNSLYNISFTGINVDNTSISTSFSALVDSGTSFTYLADPMYTDIVTNFNSKVQETRITSVSSSFEYCYAVSPGQKTIELPDISLITKNGSPFQINDPILVIRSVAGTPVGYCLAIGKGANINIIGQNFMTGLRVVFDRERLILGWKNFDCYNSAPGPALAPYNFNPQDNSQVNSSSNSSTFHSSATSSLVLLLTIFLLFIGIH